uniref:Pept_C1 domain-containing protein n=1 Tax=Elaeophora elaphi TaxID=1147741 RepID=A0A0R3RMW7_9BILA
MHGLKLSNGTDFNRRRQTRQVHDQFYQYNPRENLPHAVDWRSRGYVTSVKDQGECASCYAFATAAALETYYKRKTGMLIDLSPQNIIDCTWSLGNNGCSGGFITKVFEYVAMNGITTESKYPYASIARHQCGCKKENAVVITRGYYRILPGDELALKSAVAKFGPVVVGISGYQNGFKFYKSGVYADPECKTPNHAVLVVGYGTDPRYGDYWIIKNSWGARWGTNGYGYMARNRGNACHIATMASFPI